MNSSMATRSSRRARLDPTQRWMPRPKASVAVLRAVDDELVGVLEGRGVAVGRREAQQDPVVLLHRAAQVLHVVLDQSGHGHRRVEAQELLDRGGHEVGLGDQSLQVLGVVGEVPQRRADRRPRGVDAGDRASGAWCRRRARGPASGRRSRRSARSVVRSSRGFAWWSSIWRDEVLLDRHELLDALLFGQVDAVDDDVDELAEGSSSSSGNPSIWRMTAAGMNWAYSTAAVDDLVARDIASSSSRHSARICGSSALTGPGANAGRMMRRAIWWNGGSDVMGGATPIGRGQRLLAGTTVVDDDGAAGEVLGVLGDRRHAGVGRGEPPAAVALGVRDRAALAQVLPDRVGVVHPLGVGVVPVGREVGHGRRCV